MKLFAVVLMALVAVSYASSRHQTSEEIYSHRNGQRMRQNSESSSEEISNSRSRSNWNNFDQELEEILEESLSFSSSSSHQFQSAASKLPQAQSFKNKINHRLNGSDSISRKPELRRKLIKVAEQKLENCKTPSGQELDKHCVGRTTGQMMQLIAAVENVNHQTVGHNSRSSDY